MTTSSCDTVEAHEFDFWLGEWDVSWGDDGRGTNTVTRILDGCVVLEEFDGAPSEAFRGMSVSVYNPQQQVWQQTWVDNAGNYLDFVGGLLDGRMVLSRETVVEDRPIQQRMVWYNISDDELDWNWERSDDGGKTWEVLWHIHYRRRT